MALATRFRNESFRDRIRRADVNTPPCEKCANYKPVWCYDEGCTDWACASVLNKGKTWELIENTSGGVCCEFRYRTVQDNGYFLTSLD